MRKTLTVLLTLVMVMGLLISCKFDLGNPKDLCGEVKMEGGAKALSASTELPGAGELYWTYTAKRTDGGFYITGQKLTETRMKGTLETGLPTTLGQFSYGTWEFEFFAYAGLNEAGDDVDPATLVYKGKTSNFKVSKETQTLTMTVELAANSQGTGSITFDYPVTDGGIIFELPGKADFPATVEGKTVTLYMGLDGTDFGAIASKTIEKVDGKLNKIIFSNEDIIKDDESDPFSGITQGVHILTFSIKMTNGSETEVITYDAVGIRVIPGQTTKISGTFTSGEFLGDISLGAQSIIIPTYDIQSFTTPASDAAVKSATVKSNYVPDTSPVTGVETKQTEVTFPEGSLDTSTDHRLDMTIIPLAAASSKFSIEVDNQGAKTPVAGIDLTLTEITTETSQGHTVQKEKNIETFNGKYVEISTYIMAGLDADKVEVKYNGTADGVIVNTLSYDSVTGLLKFETNHFSEYYVVADAEALNVTTNRGYTSLEAAVNAAEDGDEIKIVKNVALGTRLEIQNKEITLNLDGKVISYSGAELNSGIILVHNAAKLTVTGNGTITSGQNATAAIALTKSGDDASKKAELVIENGTITGKNFAIVGNGQRHNTAITINGGTISSTEGLGIYQPQNGDIIVNGGTITGVESAIEMRSGNLVINGGSFTATSETFSCNANDNGTTTVGAAIAVAQHNTKKDISITINGGTFTGIKALNESNPQANDPAPHVVMSITGGTFNGEVSLTDVQQCITGGSYSSDPSAYVAEGKLANFADNVWTVDNIPEGAVAMVSGHVYESLAEAIAAANEIDNAVIDIFEDVELTGSLGNVEGPMTINGHGHTIAYADDYFGSMFGTIRAKEGRYDDLVQINFKNLVFDGANVKTGSADKQYSTTYSFQVWICTLNLDNVSFKNFDGNPIFYLQSYSKVVLGDGCDVSFNNTSLFYIQQTGTNVIFEGGKYHDNKESICFVNLPTAGSGSATVTVNGGEFYSNTAKVGTFLNSMGTKTRLVMNGGNFHNNTAETGCIVYSAQAFSTSSVSSYPGNAVMTSNSNTKGGDDIVVGN